MITANYISKNIFNELIKKYNAVNLNQIESDIIKIVDRIPKLFDPKPNIDVKRVISREGLAASKALLRLI